MLDDCEWTPLSLWRLADDRSRANPANSLHPFIEREPGAGWDKGRLFTLPGRLL